MKFFPDNYFPILSERETERAIKLVKDIFQRELSGALRLSLVTSPLFVKAGSGINDDLNGVERPVRFDEVKDFVECGLCGTAAVISPVGLVHTKDGDIKFASGMEEMGPVISKLRETLTGIQMGEIEAPEGWIHRIC